MLELRRLKESGDEKKAPRRRGGPFERIGQDACRIICEMSEPRELCRLQVASRAFRTVASDSKMWIKFILRDFPLISGEQLEWRLHRRTAKDFYLEMSNAGAVTGRRGRDGDDNDVEVRQDCSFTATLWDSFHRHIIPVLVPLVALIITALIVTRLEHQEEHSQAVQRGVQESSIETLVGNIDHTWVALLWWLLLPILGTGAVSVWYARVWWRDLYFDLAGPLKAFTSKILSDNLSEMHLVCPAFLLLLFGVGLFSLRVSNLVANFSYWWATFPAMMVPVFMLVWSYQVFSLDSVFDAALAIGATLCFTFPLIIFTTLLTLYLDGESIKPLHIFIPLFITEGFLLLFLFAQLLLGDNKRRKFWITSSLCFVFPLYLFQVLLALRADNGWSFAQVFAPCFIAELFLLTFGCLWTGRELQLLPQQMLDCIDDEDPDIVISDSI